MKDRTLIKDLKNFVDKGVKIAGWIETRRDHGKLIFLVIRDRSGIIQAVIHAGDSQEVFEKADLLKEEYVVEIKGLVKKRPEKMVKEDEFNGDLEMQILDINILSKAEALPFDKDAELNIETHLDHLPLTLRKEKIKFVFKLQAELIKNFREALNKRDFTEFQSPAIVGGDAEGGAGVFKVDYFKDKTAFLATSPQLYKQMLVGVFERVYSTGKVFRAEKHATSRHLSEYTSLDFEMGFVDSFEDVMENLEYTIRYIFENVNKKFESEFEKYGLEKALLPETSFPKITLEDAKELIYKETGRDIREEPDLDPEGERFISDWAKKEHKSDFVFVTHYPFSKRPFYTRKNKENPELTDSFDLLYRGVEVTTGGQREHDYETLVSQIKEKGLDPDKFKFYLQAFKYGIPPHGGIGMGLERLTAKTAGVKNVKEATLFPRDMTRIDLPLHYSDDENQEGN